MAKIAHTADKSAQQIAQEEQAHQEAVQRGKDGDSLAAAKNWSVVGSARRQAGSTEIILTDEQMKEPGRDLFAKPTEKENGDNE